MGQVSIESLTRLEAAITQLPGDSEYIIQALTEKIASMSAAPGVQYHVPQDALQFLLEGGQITADEFMTAQQRVERGSLQVRDINTWLSAFLSTISLESLTRRLGWNESEIREAVAQSRLYAVIVSDEPRFPTWQFQDEALRRLLPGLQTIIKAIPPTLNWVTVASFMSTPQPDLIAKTSQTPVSWLSDGREISDVLSILERMAVS